MDTGGAGWKSFEEFRQTIISQSETRVLAFLNIVGAGMLGAVEQDVSEMEPIPCAEMVARYPQHMVNVACTRGTDLSTQAVTLAISEAEACLAGNGRVLLRASGTEPVVRVMVEGQDEALVKGLADQLAETVAQQLT